MSRRIRGLLLRASHPATGACRHVQRATSLLFAQIGDLDRPPDGRSSPKRVSAILRRMDGVVLVLNQNYEPLNVCNLPRAFRLLFGERAEVIEYDHQVIRTPRTEYRAPSVIRLQHLIRRPRPRVKLSRREVFVRDHYTCQYCGRQSHDLTLDHVVPRHRGGGHTWDNLVTACKPCNHRKGGKTLAETHFRLQPSPVRAAQRRLLALHAVPGRRAQRRVALVPVPGSELIAAEAVVERRIADAIPGPVMDVLRTLWASGHAAYVVGGSVRDVILGREPYDWDLATDARPDRVQELFPGAVYENRVRDGRRQPARPRRRPGHDVPPGPRLRRLPAPASSRIRGHDRVRPRAARLHGQRDGLGRRCGRAAARRDCRSSSIRMAAAPTPRRGSFARSATRGPASRRTRCGWSGPFGCRDARSRRGGGDPRRDPGAILAREPPVRRADRDRARQAARGPDARRSACDC